jgi:hypothetical protein
VWASRSLRSLDLGIATPPPQGFGVWLLRSSRFFFGLLIVMVFRTSFLVVGGFSVGPSLNFTNDSAQNVTVTATWSNQSRDLGIIEPGATISLTVRDEASMVFNVRHADGREMASEPVHFTSGVTIDVSISEDSIDVQHNFDT